MTKIAGETAVSKQSTTNAEDRGASLVPSVFQEIGDTRSFKMAQWGR